MALTSSDTGTMGTPAGISAGVSDCISDVFRCICHPQAGRYPSCQKQAQARVPEWQGPRDKAHVGFVGKHPHVADLAGLARIFSPVTTRAASWLRQAYSKFVAGRHTPVSYQYRNLLCNWATALQGRKSIMAIATSTCAVLTLRIFFPPWQNSKKTASYNASLY